MDEVVLGLSISVAIVIVLLLSCWDKKAKPARRVSPPCSRSAMTPASQEDTCRSNVGRGVVNRDFEGRFNQLSNITGYEDYNAVAQMMALEPEVFESQETYAEDMGRSTSGASVMSVRDDRQDIVPWVGLRRPTYDAICTGAGARQEATETQDQMPTRSFYALG